MTAYTLRPPIEVLGRCFHELGPGLYQWVGAGFSEFPRIVFLNKYMAAYSPWLGKKVLLYGKDLYRALLGSYIDPIVGSAAPPSEGYWKFLHDHPLQYASYSAAGPLFGVAFSITIMLVGMKMMKNGNPFYKSLGAMLAMTGVFSYIPEVAWAIRMGQDYWIMDFYANPMDDIVKVFVVLFPPGIALGKIGYELLKRVSRPSRWQWFLTYALQPPVGSWVCRSAEAILQRLTPGCEPWTPFRFLRGTEQ